MGGEGEWGGHRPGGAGPRDEEMAQLGDDKGAALPEDEELRPRVGGE